MTASSSTPVARAQLGTNGTQAHSPALSSPIAIQPIARQPGISHPRISVVIPTYEPDKFLAAALKSVLVQDPGPGEMQIAIVDDGSAKARPAPIVESVAPTGRVEIYEHADNLGLAGNWNRAISLARGDFIHVLHQDDLVCPGFYTRLIEGLGRSPRIGMAFCRHAYTNEDNVTDRITHRERWRAGVLSNWLERIAEQTRIQCPAAIVKREAYERLGGFHQELRYALDWEMWVRIATCYDVWYEPAVLAHYRRHRGAETARLEATDRINSDLMNAIAIFGSYLPESGRDRIQNRAYRRLAHVQMRRARKLLLSHSSQQAANHLAGARATLDRLPESLHKRWAHRRLLRLETSLASEASRSAG